MNASIKDDIKRKLDLINCNDIEKIKEVVDDIEQMLGIATAGGGSFSRTGSFDYRQWPQLFGHEIVDVKKVFWSLGVTYNYVSAAWLIQDEISIGVLICIIRCLEFSRCPIA